MTDRKVPANLADALAELMQRLPRIRKEATGQYGKYADLADVSHELLPILGSLGLSFTSRPTLVQREDGTRELVLAYRLLHVSGDKDEGEYPLPASGTPQQIGSAITYARRYALGAATGAVADVDDDAKLAEGTGPQRTHSDRELRGKDLREHNALRKEGRPTVADLRSGKLEHHVKGTDPDDPFYTNGQPPGDLPVTYPPGQRQLASVHMYFDRLGKDDTPFDDEERLGITARLAGTGPVESTKDLTQDQVKTVLKKLAEFKTGRQLREAVAAMAEGEDAGA